MINVTILFKTR